MAKAPWRRSSLLTTEFQVFYDLRKAHPSDYSDRISDELNEWENKVKEIHEEYKTLEEEITKKKNENPITIESTEAVKEFSADHFKTLYDVCDIIKCYIIKLKLDKEYEDHQRNIMKKRTARLNNKIYKKLQNNS